MGSRAFRGGSTTGLRCVSLTSGLADALYVQLAVERGLPLVTTDRILSSAPACESSPENLTARVTPRPLRRAWLRGRRTVPQQLIGNRPAVHISSPAWCRDRNTGGNTGPARRANRIGCSIPATITSAATAAPRNGETSNSTASAIPGTMPCTRASPKKLIPRSTSQVPTTAHITPAIAPPISARCWKPSANGSVSHSAVLG